MNPGQVRDFTIERELGTGGMASVYLARQNTTGRRVALKLMHAQLAKDATFLQRFLQEVRATTVLAHENIVQVLACGEDGGSFYMAMDYVEGGTVGTLLRRARKFPSALVANLAAQLLEGLRHAHAQGIIHRDIKPANLMLTRQGVLKICDFGIAKTQGGAHLTKTGTIIGTPAYMSPEQAAGRPVDARSDLFSVGVVLYELLSGQNPYQGENDSATLLKVLQSQPPPLFETEPTVPPALDAIVERLMERDPAQRHGSAAEALADLQPVLERLDAASPALVADFLSSPHEARQRLSQQQAEAFLTQARERLAREPAEPLVAALELYRAVLLAPEDAQAHALLQEVCASQNLSFEPARNPKIAELQAALEQTPDAAGLLVQLGSLYRLEGNVYRAAVCLKRAIRLRPADGYLAGQLASLTGERTRTGTFVPAPSVSTRRPAAAPQVSRASAEAPNASGASGLHTGHTGKQPVRTPESTGSLPLMNQPGLTFYADGSAEAGGAARSPWLARGGKLLALVLVLGGGSWGVQRISRGIDTATQEAGRAMDLSLQAREESEREARRQRALAEQVRFREQRKVEAERDFNTATRLEETGKPKEAAEAFQAFATRHPDEVQVPRALVRRARALLAARETQQALTELQAFRETYPGHPESLEAEVLLAEAFLAMNRNGEAIETATRFLAGHETSELAGRVRLARARAEVRLGSREDARKDAEWLKGRYTSSDPLYQQAEALLSELEGMATVGPP
jgi:tetratricopeptide (TPR) repeat protein/tRNA A-37 threonylcarbamoyl transferase component Bud32